MGPHTSALTEENTALLWEDVSYQVKAGFVRVVSESELFSNPPAGLKISRAAVVPQVNRRGRIIVNLSAQVEMPPTRLPGKRRKRTFTHPSVNETTDDAEDQSGVKALGTARPSLLKFMFEVDCEWEIDWQKVDLSDGFWRMIVEAGEEHNFVFQMPPREGDTEKYYVVPSSLQMGWKNSPAYFCTTTESTCTLIQRLLALTISSGIPEAHRHENYCVEPPETEEPIPEWAMPTDLMILARVFVDDFMNGIAGPRGRPNKRQENEWVSRATLHAVHAVFPPPDVLNHVDGKDSVSLKKLKKGDARLKTTEELLGTDLHGDPGAGRTLNLAESKMLKYVERIQALLDKLRNFTTIQEFQSVHGKLQYACLSLPCLRGLMTPLNRALAPIHKGGPPRATIGLKQGGELRETLEDFIPLLHLAHQLPTHITEIVPPDLPHYYGYVDFAACGFGGVWLPCTRWVQPTVWRVKSPPDIAKSVREENGPVNNNDGEAGAVVMAEWMLEDLLGCDTAGVSTHLHSDNSSTVGWNNRMATRATHKAPERFLRWQALRQRWTRRGPADVTHVAGVDNDLGDDPSRSYDPGPAGGIRNFPEDSDDEAFLAAFSRKYPLHPQLGSWRLARPSPAITSAVFSLLRNQYDRTVDPATVTGGSGVGLPTRLANTLASPTFNAPATTWNEAGCSWPLLAPSGEVSSTVADGLRQRRSRRPFANAPSAWTTGDLQTLGERLKAKQTSTGRLKMP